MPGLADTLSVLRHSTIAALRGPLQLPLSRHPRRLAARHRPRPDGRGRDPAERHKLESAKSLNHETRFGQFLFLLVPRRSR